MGEWKVRKTARLGRAVFANWVDDEDGTPGNQNRNRITDFWDQTHEVDFEVRVKRRRRVTLEPDVYQRIEEQARARGIAPETLVNIWLVERLQQATG